MADVHPPEDASTETTAMRPNADAGAVRTGDNREHLGLLYLVHNFEAAPRWDFRRHYDALPRDPYVQNIGIPVDSARTASTAIFSFPLTRRRAASLGGRGRDAGSNESNTTGNSTRRRSWTTSTSPPSSSFPTRSSTSLRDTRSPRATITPPPRGPMSTTTTPNRIADLLAFLGRRRRFGVCEIIARFAAYARLDPRYASRAHVDVGVHLIRIAADVSASDMRGQVVPEGMHQDGFEYVGLGCVGRENVADGWTTRIYLGGRGRSRPTPGTKPVFAHAVEPGEMIFMDDARMWHDADDLAQEDESRPGWMDFIVVTLAADDNVGEDNDRDDANERATRTPGPRAPYRHAVFERWPRR